MDKRTIELIECCRPGSDDARTVETGELVERMRIDPEARALYERVQQWDAAVSEIMQEIEPAADFQSRLLATLSLPASVAAPPAAGDSAGLPALDEALRVTAANGSVTWAGSTEATTARWSRRQWIGTLSTVAAGLALALVLNSVLRSPQDTPLDEMAGEWQTALTDEWRDMEQAPRGFAVPAGFVGRASSWQWIGKALQGRGVAYQLRDAQGAAATLYVVQMDRPEEPSAPPNRPQSTTGGRAVGYWQHAGKVFVLVTSSEASYRRLVQPATAPLA